MSYELPDLSAVLPALASALPTALLIALGAVLLNSVLRRALRLVARRTRFTEQETAPIQRILKWLVALSALVLILGAFGLNVGGFWGVLSTVLAMVAIGFVAVWSVLSNTLCTLIIMIFRPFSVGDEIEFVGEAVKGRVADLNFIYTTLDCGDGCVMQVPNNLFLQKVIRRRHSTTAVSPAEHMRAKRPEPVNPDPVPGAAAPTRS